MTKFTPTPEQIETVEQMAACGEPHTDIAVALGCSMAHLREHFMDYLLNGAVRKKRDMLARLFAMAEKSPAAARDVIDRIERGAMLQRPAAQQPQQGTPAAPAKVQRLPNPGKKAALVEAAHHPSPDNPMGALMGRRMGGSEGGGGIQ